MAQAAGMVNERGVCVCVWETAAEAVQTELGCAVYI